MRGEWCRRKEVSELGSSELRKLPSEDGGTEYWGNRRFEVGERADQRNWAVLRSYRRLVALIFQWGRFSNLSGFSPAATSGLGVDSETMDGWDFAREI